MLKADAGCTHVAVAAKVLELVPGAELLSQANG